jgi:hypothetical protein
MLESVLNNEESMKNVLSEIAFRNFRDLSLLGKEA